MAERPMLRWIVLIVAALVGGYLLFDYLGLIVSEAIDQVEVARGLVAQGRIAEVEVGNSWERSVRMLMTGGSQPGFILGLAVATAFYRRNAWSVLRNATILAWLFAAFDIVLTFRILPS